MPLKFQFENELGIAALWELTNNSVEEIASDLPEKESEYLIRKIKNKQTLKHKLAARRAMKSVFSAYNFEYKGIEKSEIGAPKHDSLSLSLSHKGDFAFAKASDKLQQLGIDLEYIENPKTQVIAKKFLHPEELSEFENSIAYCTKAWAAKEALYKMIKTPGLHFAKQLRLTPINEDKWTGKIILKNTEVDNIPIFFEEREGMLLAFCGI